MAGNNAWMTSFYFKQELRSYYMNGVLSASLRPGIYNANIGLFTRSTGASVNAPKGIDLFIKKGSTFIFSNNYDLNNQNVLERNLDDVGNYLIKCFALEDIVVPLVALDSAKSSTILSEDILGYRGLSASERFYVIASVNYDKNNDAAVYEPSFKCVINNKNYTSSEASPFYTSVTSGGTDDYLPDGYDSATFDAKSGLGQSSYLWVGTVVDSGNIKYYLPGNPGGSGSSSGSSNVEWDNTNNANVWLKNHAFIGRGLPEYRHSLSSDNLTESPDLLIDTGNTSEGENGFRNTEVSFNTLVLDLPSALIGNRFIKNRHAWQNLYSAGSYKYNIASNNTKIVVIKDYENQENSELKNLSNGNYIITDFIYLTLKNKDSSLEDVDLKTIYTVEDLVDIKNYSWVSEISENIISSESLSSKFITNTLTKGTTNANIISEDIFEGRGILPLDVSSINTERLLNIVENKNILPKVINKLRQIEDINPEDEDLLIPAAFIFRGFKKEGNQITFTDNISSYNKFNPANVLCLFDLQFKSNKINVLNVYDTNTYSIIPVME